MPDQLTMKDALTVAVTGGVVGIGHVYTQWRNSRKAKSGQSTLARIEEKIDQYQAETRAAYQQLTTRLDEVQTDATDALHHVIGPDGRNGLRSRMEGIEKWQESETMRERHRLEQLERDRELDLRLGPPDRRAKQPTDIGTLTPRTT